MRKAGKIRVRQGIWKGVLTLALVMLIGLFWDGFATVSHAASQGRVTAASANIRKEPSTTSEVVGSTEKDKIIDINNQVLGSDGKMWYQTFVNSETLGYIRSDLVEIIDGSTPPTVTAVEPTPGGTGTATPPATTPSGSVEALNPVSATVKGGSVVRIRSSASTSGDIVTTVSNGLVLTVTGRSSDSSGKTWYQVSFSDNGAEVQGFIREDYVTVSGELTPYVEEPVVDEPPVEPEPDQADPGPVSNTKAMDTKLVDGEWYLLDYEKNQQHKIQDIFDAVDSNEKAYDAEHKKAETEKVVIIILIFLLVAAVSGIAMLVFKIKDMSDDAYFNQVERETLRRRGEARAQGGSQKVMHTVGTDKSASGKPAGTRPVGAPQGQKTVGARPAGAPQSQKPSGGSQGQKTAGERPAGARPAGAPQSQKPSGSSQGQKTAGEKPTGGQQGQKPSGSSQGQRPAESRQGQSNSGEKPAKGQQGWQSKNFMSEDDDEFEFGFLNYDGTED